MGFTQARRWGLLALTFVVGICAGYLAWDIISFPFFNPEGVVGPLTLISFNPMNNQVRFVVFILMPALLLLAAQPWLRYLSHGALPQSEVEWKCQNLEAYQLLFRISCWVTCLFAISSVCFFFAQPFDPSPLDFFHEGGELSPSLELGQRRRCMARVLCNPRGLFRHLSHCNGMEDLGLCVDRG